MATARLGTGTANATTYLRGDGTWAAAGGGYTVFSTTIGSTNVGGNGTYYVGTAGASVTEKDNHRLLSTPCNTIRLAGMADGALTSGYTLSFRKGVSDGNKPGFSDLPSSAITIIGVTQSVVTVTSANLVAGNILDIKLVGTATFSSQEKLFIFHADVLIKVV